MINENTMGNCCYCDATISASESACRHCLNDMSKESDYNDYLDKLMDE